MGPEDVYGKYMQGSLKNLVKGGLVYKYFINPFFVWCEAFAPREEMDPKSAYMEMILRNGRDHEDEVCRELYPGGVSLDPTLHEKAFMQSLDAMFSGEKYVKNGIFYNLPESFVAVPDILVKEPGASIFGEWHYEIVEVKSSKQIRNEHVMQAAYYNHVISLLQGFTPKKFFLVDGQKSIQEFRYSEYREKVIGVIGDIKNIYAGRKPPAEKLGWPWESFSVRMLKEAKSISLIPGLYSFHRQALQEKGIRTLEDFFSLNILDVNGIGQETLDRYRKSAKALLKGSHMFLDKPRLPEGKTEIFMDFEGVEQARFGDKKISGDYLIGMVVREDGKDRYIPFLAPDLEKEHEMLLEFLRFLKGKEEFTIYHYGSYEKTHLAGLLNKYCINPEFAQKIIDSMVDILQLVRKSVAFPTHSYSLKEIGKYLGLTWSGIGDAKDSIILYMDFLKNGSKDSLDKIVQYNKEDCVALMKVKDFLVWGA